MLKFLIKINRLPVLLIVGLLLLACPSPAFSDENPPKVQRPMLKNPLKQVSIFSDFSVRNFFDEKEKVVDVTDSKDQPKEPTVASGQIKELPKDLAGTEKAANEPKKAAVNEEFVDTERVARGPMFVDKFRPGDLQPPDETPRARINPEAPASFIGIAKARQDGDHELAAKYAEQYVRYQQNLFYEVREISELIGQALINQHVIKEDDWDGVQQYLDYFSAKQREIEGAVIRPTHESAMARIKADPQGKVDVYFFFTLNCSYCRFMAPDIERLWQSVKGDPNVRMAAVSLGPIPEGWVEEYRTYTGATFPILNGERVSKTFNVKFVPALVVRSVTLKTSYLKSGQQTFERMYEFVRTAQGLPATKTRVIDALLRTPIGEVEQGKVANGEWKLNMLQRDLSDKRVSESRRPVAIEIPKKKVKDGLGSF